MTIAVYLNVKHQTNKSQMSEANIPLQMLISGNYRDLQCASLKKKKQNIILLTQRLVCIKQMLI